MGVVVTEDINTTSNKLRTSSAAISQAPRASVMNPLGTIIYGGTSTVPEDENSKFIIQNLINLKICVELLDI
jgi:hypothetical protein